MRNKRDKFVELCEKRMTKALKGIRIIGNLSNKNLYEYSQNDVTLMIKALDEEIKSLKDRYQTSEKGHGITFKLNK